MSAESEQQKRVFDFFLEKYNSQDAFAKEDIAAYAGWDPQSSTFKTYWSKQFRPLLVPHGEQWRVSQYFKRFSTREKFRLNILTQNRTLGSGYSPLVHEKVVVFEFFMPLRNEEYLRAALDSLFFKDFVVRRLKTLDEATLLKFFPKIETENFDAYLERACEWISTTFVGYSISHVSGRYRFGKLKTTQEAAANPHEAYLIDETTAVTRFIIPCGKAVLNQATSTNPLHFIENASVNWQKEADQIRWFFFELFVKSVIEVVNGEDEIWLLESGIFHRLHIWKSKIDNPAD